MNYKKILIAVDDGPMAEKVASIGLQLGLQLNAEIALLSVADTSHLMTEGGVTPNELANIIMNDLKKAQHLLIEKIFKEHKVWTFIEKGKPSEIILKTVSEWEADLIVLGTHGRTGLSHLFMGSVAEHVVRHSPVPVMVIPRSH